MLNFENKIDVGAARKEGDWSRLSGFCGLHVTLDVVLGALTEDTDTDCHPDIAEGNALGADDINK